MVLNPKLFSRLKLTIGRVRISNEGVPLRCVYTPSWSLQGVRMRAQYIDRGETYFVNCPLCNDTRQRLAVNHCWAERDARTGDSNLHLVKCFNEDCLNNMKAQMQLHVLVFPDGRYSHHVDVPLKPIKVSPLDPRAICLPASTPLNELHDQHPARLYLLRRGFSPDRLASDYGLAFCDSCRDSSPQLHDPRLIVPILKPVFDVKGWAIRSAPDLAGQLLAGWQARAIRDTLPKNCPKYLTATGTPKSRLLYGLPMAIKTSGPAVIVEGVADVWNVGTNAVALLGKTISSEQCDLVLRYFRGRPVVVWLDADATEDAARVREHLRRALVGADRKSPVFIATAPAGRKDPGECNSSEISDAIELALLNKSR